MNIGAGSEISIRDLALLVRDVVGFEGPLVLDPTKPDGTLRKLMDLSRSLAMGWRPTIDLRDGIAETYRWFLDFGRGRSVAA